MIKAAFFIITVVAIVSSAGLAADRALLVGVEQYKNPSVRAALGAKDDALTTAEFIENRFGFSKDKMKVLLNEEATAANIKKWFREWLIEGTQPGDRVFFFYSGHGSQLRDDNGDEADGRDETIAPYDVEVTGTNMIRDDVFSGFIAELSGRRAVLLFDSEHSGTIGDLSQAVQGDSVTNRYLSHSSTSVELAKLTLFDFAGVIVISATRDSQLAYTIDVGGKHRGAMSYWFVEAQKEKSLPLKELETAIANGLDENRRRGHLRGTQQVVFSAISYAAEAPTGPSEGKPLSAASLAKPVPKDSTPPKIQITSPSLIRGVGVIPTSRITVTGLATDDSGVNEVTVRGQEARLREDGKFSAEVLLKIGDNLILVTATDIYGNRLSESFTVRRENEPPPPPVTGRYFALVIGNNRYPNLSSTQQLETAINDAQEVAKLLRADYGFEIKLLTDAKRVEIINALNQYRRSLMPDDKLLVYYAGHGHFDNETGRAYWIPTDGEQSSNANWIISDQVTSDIKAIPARHILIVSDSCYSGAMYGARTTIAKLSTPAERERYLEKMRSGTARILMASGGNEPVTDGGGSGHSVFARALLDGLRGMNEQVFTAEELFHGYIKERVAGKSDQTPEYNPLRNSGHVSGDFVFVRKP